MRWLDSYRRQLAEEAEGRSHRFADILRYFRTFWMGSIVIGVSVALWFIVSELRHPYPGSGWGVIIGPVFAIVIIIAGRVPYALAQLFLSVDPKRK
ncbi:hypothetical protein [Sandarakinorhabdus sp.]|uniref:hypothetical protein n=1 Tax=Sandarakinorhabdus sp. TaxID=1916663 RepID=UPI00286E7DDB|nr:hypothetical protein [Sandarakinorhabdus sp.]